MCGEKKIFFGWLLNHSHQTVIHYIIIIIKLFQKKNSSYKKCQGTENNMKRKRI